MWSEALSMLERADRLHRQFFVPPLESGTPAWEPPADIVESAEGLRVHLALPGVRADSILLALDEGGVTVSATRAFPCREPGAHIHRVEIPYGRFERRLQLPLDDPYAPLELSNRSLSDGVLTLTFRRKEST
jgi:HSP20 family molecular chaperone IbpA